MDGETLGRLIEASGLSQRAVGRAMGVSYTLVRFYVRGERKITENFEARVVPYLTAKAHERLRQISEAVTQDL